MPVKDAIRAKIIITATKKFLLSLYLVTIESINFLYAPVLFRIP